MARLIDADKLIYQSHAQHIQPYINKKDIDDAPTVEMAEDCVKREELLKEVMARIEYLHDVKDIKDHVREAIEIAPSVTPQPKRGQWISVDDGGMCVDGYCSECNNFIPKNVRKILRDYCDGDFCPNCGADMKEVQDND